jgi:8-oxo-dGTP pyrophosphatase MutT (NUDIX family)
MDKEKINPWITKSIRLVYENPWIEIEHHEVTTPTGTEGIYGKVKMKNLAIGIIPLDDDLNTWLVGQYRYTLHEYSWEIPMGGGPLGIDPIISAKRELKEETGLTAKSWNQIVKVHPSNCVTDEIGYVFVATDLHYGKTNFDETEDIAIKKLPLSEAFEMAFDGRITDALSVIGLLKLARDMEK